MSRSVLVIDDSASVRTLMRMALERSGFEVFEAGDGEAAMAVLDGRTLSVIVSDLEMPRLNGLEFLRHLRAHPRYRFTPLIVLTTETRTEVKDAARKAGAQAFINKPCTPTQLLSTVQRLCQ